MTVRELLARTSSRELTEWQVYEKVTGPLGPPRADIHTGIIAATIANANRGGKGREYTAQDFIPKWDKRPLTPEELFQKVAQANAALGGAVKRKEG
ncbi:phage tail assembly protein T [Streptomyces ovatisporus]